MLCRRARREISIQVLEKVDRFSKGYVEMDTGGDMGGDAEGERKRMRDRGGRFDSVKADSGNRVRGKWTSIS